MARKKKLITDLDDSLKNANLDPEGLDVDSEEVVEMEDQQEDTVYEMGKIVIDEETTNDENEEVEILKSGIQTLSDDNEADADDTDVSIDEDVDFGYDDFYLSNSKDPENDDE